jgi:hypothetical protein
MLRVHAQYFDEYTGMMFICVDTPEGSKEREELLNTFNALAGKLNEKDLVQTITSFYVHLPLDPEKFEIKGADVVLIKNLKTSEMSVFGLNPSLSYSGELSASAN